MNIKNLKGNITLGLKELQALATALDGRGASVALTGGAVRDQLHGVPPNDLDFALVGADPSAVSWADDALYRLGYEMCGWFDQRDNNYADAFPGGEDRFVEIRKYANDETGTKLDLLVYTAAFPTIADALASHDHTISQFAAELVRGELLVTFQGHTPWGECHLLRPGVGAPRIARIKDVCQILGWRYVE